MSYWSAAVCRPCGDKEANGKVFIDMALLEGIHTDAMHSSLDSPPRPPDTIERRSYTAFASQYFSDCDEVALRCA